MPDQTEVNEVLGSAVYRTAFEKVMTGTEPGLLDDDERGILRRARDLTATPAPGYPMPLDLDPTRPDSGSEA